MDLNGVIGSVAKPVSPLYVSCSSSLSNKGELAILVLLELHKDVVVDLDESSAKRDEAKAVSIAS